MTLNYTLLPDVESVYILIYSDTYISIGNAVVYTNTLPIS